MDRQALKLVDVAAMAGGTATGTNHVHFPYQLGTLGVHEIAPETYGDGPAALGFALTAGGGECNGALLWIREDRFVPDRGRPCGDGLRALGIDPGRLLTATARSSRDALWATEEAMKSGAVGLVLTELAGVDFTATRRLALASEAQASAAILCLPHTLEGATAAMTRWRVRAAPSAPNRLAPGQVGRLRWQARLERARNAPHAIGRSHGLEFNHETLSIDLVPGLAAGPAPPPQETGTGDLLSFPEGAGTGLGTRSRIAGAG